MPFIPVQVSDFATWGKLIISWATGKDYMTGGGTTTFAPLLPAADPAAFTDDTAVKMTLPNFTAFLATASNVAVTYPPGVTEIVFVRDTPSRRYVRLPDPVMTAAAYTGFAGSAGSYELPPFYIADPLYAHDPKGHAGSYPPLTAAQQIGLQANRVGDYSIGSCA